MDKKDKKAYKQAQKEIKKLDAIYSHRKSQSKYEKTPKGKATQKRYIQSSKGKKTIQRRKNKWKPVKSSQLFSFL